MAKTMCKTRDEEKRIKKQANHRFKCAKYGEDVNKKEIRLQTRKIIGYLGIV